MTAPLTTLSVSDQLYSYMLASRWRSPFIYDPTNALAQEPDIWEIIRNDTDIASCIQRRNQSIVRPWRIVPSPHGTTKTLGQKGVDASRMLAAICNEAFSHITRFDSARRALAEAFVLGRRYARIYFEEKSISLDGTKPLSWFIPVRIQDVDRRRFHWEPVWSQGANPKKVGINLKMFDTNGFGWQTLGPDARRKYIEYVWEDTEDRLGYGRGALEALFFLHYFKSGTIKKLIEGVDRWANGFLLGKLDTLRAASTDKTNEDLKSDLLDLLKIIRSEHVGVVEKTDDIQVLEPTGKGLQTAMDLVRYFNESAERYCNGSVRPAGHSVDGTGSKAAGKVEEDTSEAFYQFPREDLDSVLDRDLLGAFLYYNEGNITALGLAQAKRPKFTSEQIKRQDPATRIEVLNQSKVPILLTEYYEAIEATPPGPEDEVVDATPLTEMLDAEIDGDSGFPKTRNDSPEREKIKTQQMAAKAKKKTKV